MNQIVSRTVPLAVYKAALSRGLLQGDVVLWRPQGQSGGELVIGLERALSLETLRLLAECEDRALLIERAVESVRS